MSSPDVIRPVYLSPLISPGDCKAVGDFVSRISTGKPEAFRDFWAMAVMQGADLIAGTVYHNHHPDSGVIELSSASLSRRWLTRPVIRAMFTLPFDLLSCQLVVLRVSEQNETMIRIARSFGFSETYIPRLRGRDEGEHVFTYTDDQWRASRYRGA